MLPLVDNSFWHIFCRDSYNYNKQKSWTNISRSRGRHQLVQEPDSWFIGFCSTSWIQLNCFFSKKTPTHTSLLFVARKFFRLDNYSYCNSPALLLLSNQIVGCCHAMNMTGGRHNRHQSWRIGSALRGRRRGANAVHFPHYRARAERGELSKRWRWNSYRGQLQLFFFSFIRSTKKTKPKWKRKLTKSNHFSSFFFPTFFPCTLGCNAFCCCCCCHIIQKKKGPILLAPLILNRGLLW